LTPATAPTAPPVSEKSIAVLPFTDMSQKKDQEYFGDGMKGLEADPRYKAFLRKMNLPE